jgi:hypothetical protein
VYPNVELLIVVVYYNTKLHARMLQGGAAPAGTCSEDDGEYSSPYTAEYWYWVALEDPVCGSASIRTSSVFSF